MHRNLAKLLLSLIVLLNVTSALAKDDKAFFWQVKSDNAVVYLMGSIHFAKSGFYPLRERIEEAFEHSDALVVELDINHIDSNTYSQLIAQRGTYKDSTTIKDVISEETWLQLRQRLRYLNVSYDTIKNYKPGILVLTLTSIQIMQMGFAPQLGIDAYFLAKASQADKQKKIIELETLEQQINLFLNIPDGELLLKESLYSLDESELLMADMVRFWKQGDEAEMNKLLFEDALTKYPAFSAIYESLFYDRNSRMVEKIDGMLQQKGRYFVVIGSGHLIGEKGIVSALKEKGYEVSRK